jgi:hypothetical protein
VVVNEGHDAVLQCNGHPLLGLHPCNSLHRDVTADSGDYSSALGTLTFIPGEATKTISIATTLDTVPDEPSEAFQVHLHNEMGATIQGSVGIGTILEVTFTPAQISIETIDGLAFEEAANSTAVYRITRTGGSPNSIEVFLSEKASETTAEPGDYSLPAWRCDLLTRKRLF